MLTKTAIIETINATAQGKKSGVSVMTYNETRDFLSIILRCEPDVDTENHEHKRYCRFYPNGKKGTANKVELWERDSKLFSLYVGKNTAFYADNEKAFNNADSVDVKQGKATSREVRLVIPKNSIYNVLGNYIGSYVNSTKKAEKQDKKQA
jgi:hypothetical protein